MHKPPPIFILLTGISIFTAQSPSAQPSSSPTLQVEAQKQATIAWLKSNALPLKTVEAGNGFQDLQPLKQVFNDVRFVGLGEQTHGTREFFQFKHRMLEFLVREMGFRVLAMEASYSACQNINDYVMGRTDDGAKALDGQGFWIWNTEEVRAMLDWMRQYNAGAGPDRKVKCVGVDIQVNATARSRLLEYLQRVAPERAAEAATFLKVDEMEMNNVASQGGDKAKEAMAKRKELKERYNELFVFLEISGARLAAASTQAEYDQMREFARVMVQFMDSYSNPSQNNSTRDLYMADNFQRMVQREPAGTRFVLWAHNNHICTGFGGNKSNFGYYLRRFYGKEYYALGFSFNQGAFQAREAQPKDPTKRLLMSFTVTPARADSIDWYLAQVGVKNFIVDFRSERRSAALDEWLTAPHPMRSVGPAFAPALERSLFRPATIGKEFDGLFFIDATTRARPNSSVKGVAQTQ